MQFFVQTGSGVPNDKTVSQYLDQAKKSENAKGYSLAVIKDNDDKSEKSTYNPPVSEGDFWNNNSK